MDRRLLVLLALLVPMAPAFSEPGSSSQPAAWPLCTNAFSLPTRPPDASPLDVLQARDPEEVRLSADTVDMQEGGRSTFTGDVFVERGLKAAGADKAIYDEARDILDAEGNVKYWEGGVYLDATQAHFDFGRDSVEANGAAFMDAASHARGTGSRFKMSGSDLVDIRNGTYTTCDPGRNDWMLDARKVRLHRDKKWGTARDVKVRILEVPVFYTPYLSFPLSGQRKSGLLTPTFKLSGEAGSEVVVPYYFNLAPNRDATLAARYMSLRGLALRGQFRFLEWWGEGTLDGEILPHDPQRGAARSLLKYYQFSQDPDERRWRALVQFERVSDRDYFSDLGNSLSVSSTSFLPQYAFFDYFSDNWWTRVRLDSTQTVDPTLPGDRRPYKRLPQLILGRDLPEENLKLNFNYQTEYDYFDRKDTIVGHRIDLNPRFSYPIKSSGWFVRPTVALRYTAYALDNNTSTDTQKSFIDRVIPTFKLDTGLFLERDVSLAGSTYRSTIEPRLFYLYVPFEDQSELPLFDTSVFTFDFAQLFRDNRFTGADRIADANQLSLALTSRVLAPDTGKELFRASIGQIRHFRDQLVTRAVTIPPQRRSSSDLVAEVEARLAGALTVRGGLQWDTAERAIQKRVLALRYKPDHERVVNFTYRFIRDVVEEVNSSVRWPWNPSLAFVGRFKYSVDQSQVLETFGGLEYESCCWGIRLIGQRFLNDVLSGYSTGIFLQIQLKGLAGVGNEADAFLKRTIPGYEAPF